MKYLAALLVSTTVASADVIILEDRRGGSVYEHWGEWNEKYQDGNTYRIRGFCNSSCTILTTLPNACLEPGTILHFHGASGGTPEEVLDAEEVIAQYFTGEALRRYWDDWRHYDDPAFRITAEDFVELETNARMCE